MKGPERRIEVVLSLPVVAPLVDLMRSVADGLRGQPPLPHAAPAAEAEFSDLWADELMSGRNRDVEALLALFGSDFIAEGKIYLDRHNAEPVVRACSAVRLRLRERLLSFVGDEALESGSADLEALEPAARKAFLCYLFLATVQELVIQRIDDGTLC